MMDILGQWADLVAGNVVHFKAFFPFEPAVGEPCVKRVILRYKLEVVPSLLPEPAFPFEDVLPEQLDVADGVFRLFLFETGGNLACP